MADISSAVAATFELAGAGRKSGLIWFILGFWCDLLSYMGMNAFKIGCNLGFAAVMG